MKRIEFIHKTGSAFLGTLLPMGVSSIENHSQSLGTGAERPKRTKSGTVNLFLSGDVMPGRGIDQILPHSVSPILKERYVKDARRYLELAENKSGAIPKQASYEYIWGDALEVLNGLDTDIRIINLETSLTTENDFWNGKGVHYRMHPKNVELLKIAGIDICVMGNNHVLDFGHAGLQETLNTLEEAGIKKAGAGKNQSEASKPAIIQTNSGRMLAFSYGSPTAGVPSTWGATDESGGINFLPDLNKKSATRVIQHIQKFKQEGDLVIVSIHWGSNWEYDIPAAQKSFAHRLIESGEADLIHGHSSHHPKGIEVYKNRAILYGAGDLLNDYEGIGGRPQYRDDLSLMYFPQLNTRGELIALEMIPMHIKNFQLQHASKSETEFLADMMKRECKKLGTDIRLNEQGNLSLQWQA